MSLGGWIINSFKYFKHKKSNHITIHQCTEVYSSCRIWWRVPQPLAQPGPRPVPWCSPQVEVILENTGENKTIYWVFSFKYVVSLFFRLLDIIFLLNHFKTINSILQSSWNLGWKSYDMMQLTVFWVHSNVSNVLLLL